MSNSHPTVLPVNLALFLWFSLFILSNNFWWNTALCKCSTHQIYRGGEFYSWFPNWKCIERIKELRTWRTLKEIRQYNFTQYQKWSFKGASTNGKLSGGKEWFIQLLIHLLFFINPCGISVTNHFIKTSGDATEHICLDKMDPYISQVPWKKLKMNCFKRDSNSVCRSYPDNRYDNSHLHTQKYKLARILGCINVHMCI